MNVVAIQNALISHALSLGLFASVSGHEPKAAPPNGIYGALWVQEMLPARSRSGLASTSLRITFNFRIGTNMIAEPQDGIDSLVMVAAASLMAAYTGDFTLGSEAANLDLLGASGEGLSARAGYLSQDSHLYRVMVVSIPIIVNDVLDQAP